jgi:hypothetical protein
MFPRGLPDIHVTEYAQRMPTVSIQGIPASALVGLLLAIAGLGWVLNELIPYLLPASDPGFLMITSNDS